MGWLSWFGSDTVKETANNVLDKDDGLLSQVGGWIGNYQFTDEERSEANQKTVDVVIDYAKQQVDQNSERSKARRDIAKMWFKLQAGLVLCTAIAIPADRVLGSLIPDYGAGMTTDFFNLATSTLMVATTSAMTIFYFGSYGIERFRNAKKSGK